MDLNEAFRRIFYAHRRAIVLFVALGVIGGVALASVSPASYTAAARITIGERSEDATGDLVSIADGAEAIATSRSVLVSASQAAELDGDPVVVDPSAVSVKTLGSSEFLELSVTAPDVATATALANSLADEVVQRWTEVSGGTSEQALALMQETLADVLEKTASLDERITLLGLRLNQGGPDQAQIQARRDALVAEREALDRQRVSYEAQLSALLVEAASRSAPQVIDPAVSPSAADPRHTVPMGVLGALLGFLIGAGLAGLIEAISPTLVGASAIGDALGVPVLGTLSRLSDGASERSRRAVVNTALAARRAKATTVELVAMGPPVDLDALSSTLAGDEDQDASDRTAGRRARGQLAVRSFGADVAVPMNLSRPQSPTASAIVAVAPSVVKRSFVRAIQDAHAVTGWDVLGVLVYERADRRSVLRKQRASGAPARELQPRAS